MDRLNGHDDVMTRVARLDDAPTEALSDGALERITRMAMVDGPSPWSRARLRLASLGAMFGSGAVVVAGIVGLQAAAPEALPVLAIGSSASHDLGADASRTPTASKPLGGLMIPYLDYEFTSGPGLSTAAGTAVAYRLASSEDAASAVTQLAGAFGVQGSLDPSSGDGYYQIGSSDGPDVSTWDSGGVVDWSYWANANQAVASASGSSADDQNPPADPTLPTDAQAGTDATSLLESVGVDAAMLGTPQVDSSSGIEVDVTVPMVVDGIETDQSYYVSYGHDDQLLSASGVLATATAAATYPTISPVDAVAVLSADHGFVFYGIEPMTAAGTAAPADANSSSSTDPTSTDPTSTDPTSTDPTSTDPTSTDPGSGDTTPTTDPGPPVVNVQIDAATLSLGTYTLTDGTTWLLATWQLSGPESGDASWGNGTYSASVLAIDSQYVQLQPTVGIR
jgi:hypothetical protein